MIIPERMLIQGSESGLPEPDRFGLALCLLLFAILSSSPNINFRRVVATFTLAGPPETNEDVEINSD
jgi:hypothetical protein